MLDFLVGDRPFMQNAEGVWQWCSWETRVRSGWRGASRCTQTGGMFHPLALHPGVDQYCCYPSKWCPSVCQHSLPWQLTAALIAPQGWNV